MTNKLILTVFTFLLFITAQAQEGLSFLALGDSYTIGESVEEKERWPMQLQDSLNARGFNVDKPLIIARTGWRTDELKAAIEKQKPGKNYDLVGLLIGVNNQYQGKSSSSYKPEFKELLNIAIDHAGGDHSKVFVVSIPDYGHTPFGEKDKDRIGKELDEYNAINREITEDAGVKYYNITDLSRNGEPDMVASDNLHPSARQYSLWVERMLQDPDFYQLLQQ
ncbi:SGNH/GDSL hydrolase family protein [Fulvivirga sp. RKSG066]|nr:SGNH/GDSL hydrolase family protein [Fulvivirga aurantia]